MYETESFRKGMEQTIEDETGEIRALLRRVSSIVLDECEETNEKLLPKISMEERTGRASRGRGNSALVVDELDDEIAVSTVRAKGADGMPRCSTAQMRCRGSRSTGQSRRRRRSLSRGVAISRTCIHDEGDVLSEEEVARQLRPESYHRFRRVASRDTQQKLPLINE